jgi:hypothetical protein
MPDIDNHMDELFKKAAADYPLKTGKGNFDDLMPFIAGETAANVKPAVAKGKRKTALALLVFLLTGLTIGTIYITSNYRHAEVIADNPLTSGKLNALPHSNGEAQINPPEATGISANNSSENTVDASTIIFQKNKLGAFYKGKNFIRITQPDAVLDDVSANQNTTRVIPETTPVKAFTEKVNQQEVSKDQINTEVKKEAVALPAEKKEPVATETKPADKHGKKNKNKPGIYYGVATGIELNKIKNQGMTKAGLNAALVLGLQISKKISVETGVQLSQKKYYSAGEYFKPKTGTMPANMSISSLEGTSTLIEIPVSVKYNLSKKKNTLYGKAGLSTYIITKENNKYQAVISGQQQEVNGEYNKTHCYPASDIRLSMGYQHALNKKLNIRAEPYIQIPLKGIGIGALPVTSTGLQLVLTLH